MSAYVGENKNWKDSYNAIHSYYPWKAYKILEQYYDIFSLDEEEQGDTNLVEFNIILVSLHPLSKLLAGYLLLHNKKLMHN